MLQVRGLTHDEIPLLKDFPPPDWNVDLPAFFLLHFGQPYFHPLAAEWHGALVGCANALCHQEAGWLGNIIVLASWRGRGIGTALTERLIETLHQRRITHQILVATSMGESVYRKLGFEQACEYVFFDRERSIAPPEIHPRVRRLGPADEAAVLALDRDLTGESRAPFLRRFFGDSWVHVSPSQQVDGYFLPRLGSGPVIAAHDEAGLALMHHKLSLGAQACVVPDGNGSAMDYLLSQGFTETSRAPRMTLGGDVRWQPARIYCRGAGYCG